MACGHKASIGCALTALPTCCSCSDRRPLAAAYPVYIDGQGMKMQGNRWSRYCWRCRDHWDREEAEELLRQRYSAHRSINQDQWEFPAPQPVPFRSSARERQNRTTSVRATERDVRPRRSLQARQNPLVAAFGTREEIEAEGYESPISLMYERWEDRHRAAETRRSQLEIDIINPFQPREATEDSDQRSRRAPDIGIENIVQQAGRIANFVAEQASYFHPPRPNPIDTQTSRPPALAQAEMTVSIACQICNEQRSDTLLNPCFHLCMCRWCADILRADAVAAKRTREPGAPKVNHWRCPICRKDIAGVTRVYLC